MEVELPRLAVEKVVLPSGLRVLVCPMEGRVSCSTVFAVNIGSRVERPKEEGIAHFIEHLVFKGGQRWRSAHAVAEAIERLGGAINASTDREQTAFWTRVPAGSWESAWDVLADIVLEPAFREEDIPKEKRVVIEELRMYKDSPQDYVESLFDEALWPHHALGRDVAGDEESVMQLTRNQVLSFHGEEYRPDQVVVCVTGGCSSDTVLRGVEERLQHLDIPPTASSRISVPPPDLQKAFVWNPRDTEQTNVVLGTRGLAYTDERRFPLDLALTILGDGMSSRLFVRLREDAGLVYDVRASMTNYCDAGDTTIAFACDPDATVEAWDAALHTVDGIVDEGIRPEELRKAKDYLLGHLALGLEDTGAVAEFLCEHEILLGKVLQPEELAERIEAVTADEVVTVLHDIVQVQELSCAVDGPLPNPELLKDRIEKRNANR